MFMIKLWSIYGEQINEIKNDKLNAKYIWFVLKTPKVWTIISLYIYLKELSDYICIFYIIKIEFIDFIYYYIKIVKFIIGSSINYGRELVVIQRSWLSMSLGIEGLQRHLELTIYLGIENR